MCIAAVVASAFAVSAQTQIFNTSNGHRLELPVVNAIDDCAEIQNIMDSIDATDYRNGPPSSVEHPDDRLLLEYEDALSAHSYRRCQLREPQGFLSGVKMSIGE